MNPEKIISNSTESIEISRGQKLAEAFCVATESSEEYIQKLIELADKIPALPEDPHETIEIIVSFLRENEFKYDESLMSLQDVIENKAGNCLSLSILIGILLTLKGKSPDIKILIHPRDAVDEADRKLFDDLNRGEYFSYDDPKLPNLEDEDPALKINRFIPLTHPLIMLEEVPLETTLIEDQNDNPLVEFDSETSEVITLELAMSYVYCDQAKLKLKEYFKAKGKKRQEIFEDVKDKNKKSLDIDSQNRDALRQQWLIAFIEKDTEAQEEIVNLLLAAYSNDSQTNFGLYWMTKDKKYLALTLEQFPEDIQAFVEEKIILEPNEKEVKFNIAVAAWCMMYSSSYSLKNFLSEPKIKAKIAKLYSNMSY